MALASTTVYSRLIAGGDPQPAIVFDRHVRFEESDVHRWMEHHKESRSEEGECA